MKNLFLIGILIIFLTPCATKEELPKESFNKAIVGKSQMDVLKILGTPSMVEHLADGRKIMIYESRKKGMFLTPYKSAITYNPEMNVTGEREGFELTLGKNLGANDPKYTIEPTYEYFVKAYINKEGKATKVEQNIPKELLDINHERFKHFNNHD